MALEFRELTIQFDKTSGIRQREQATATFSGRVINAQAMLKGFNVKYRNGDHHILEQEVDLDTIGRRGNRVDVAADLVLRDSSGFYDDPYSGFVQCVVVAEVA